MPLSEIVDGLHNSFSNLAELMSSFGPQEGVTSSTSETRTGPNVGVENNINLLMDGYSTGIYESLQQASVDFTGRPIFDRRGPSNNSDLAIALRRVAAVGRDLTAEARTTAYADTAMTILTGATPFEAEAALADVDWVSPLAEEISVAAQDRNNLFANTVDIASEDNQRNYSNGDIRWQIATSLQDAGLMEAPEYSRVYTEQLQAAEDQRWQAQQDVRERMAFNAESAG